MLKLKLAYNLAVIQSYSFALFCRPLRHCTRFSYLLVSSIRQQPLAICPDRLPKVRFWVQQLLWNGYVKRNTWLCYRNLKRLLLISMNLAKRSHDRRE
jgi:hypothetical protein